MLLGSPTWTRHSMVTQAPKKGDFRPFERHEQATQVSLALDYLLHSPPFVARPRPHDL